MTNNTINVPRELLERASNLAFQTQHYPLHEELRTLLSAPSSANHVEDVRAMVDAPAAPAADASDVLDQAMYTLISIGYHENSGLVHELRQAIAAHRAKGVV